MESNVVWLLLLTAGVAQGQRKFNTIYCFIIHNDCATFHIEQHAKYGKQSSSDTSLYRVYSYCTRVREVVVQKNPVHDCQIRHD